MTMPSDPQVARELQTVLYEDMHDLQDDMRQSLYRVLRATNALAGSSIVHYGPGAEE
jgi:hypothetical protein